MLSGTKTIHARGYNLKESTTVQKEAAHDRSNDLQFVVSVIFQTIGS